MIIAPHELPIVHILRESGLVKRPVGVRKKKHERELVNIVTAFDIETTTLHFEPTDDCAHNDHSFMYIWQWQFGKDYTVVGRTWEEFTALTERIRDAIAAMPRWNKPLLVVYVHNLQFEFQFLRGVYPFTNDECFFRDARKPLYCRMHDALEFRCSYLQSNMSLAKFAENMGCTTRKLSGDDFDYSKIRFPWTPLTDNELAYCVNDVISLEEAIRLEMEKDGDTLKTIPSTSTGYVRRDCKKAIYPIRYSIREMLPDVEQYKLLRRAFRGGNTHANRAYVGKVLENVESVDMASCYPAQQLTKEFPTGRYQWLERPDMARVARFINRGYSVVAEYSFADMILKNANAPIPYLSISKCQTLDVIGDNGRVMSARYCNTVLTEIDLRIVLRQYGFSALKIEKAMICRKAPLPAEYRFVVQEYFNKKTALKNVDGHEYEYMKSKNKLNSVYGMSAQDPVHQQITYMDGDYFRSDYDSEDAEKVLERANFPYQWGVYTTALAREALQDGIDLAGAKIVYCDTDSVKTLGHVDFSKLNSERQALAEKNKAYADDPHGERHYVGVYEVDAHYKRFITQGAKRYAYEYEKKCALKMGVTVSGVTHKVNPATGIPYAVEELGTLENFKVGMIWSRAGGTAAVYNDDDDFYYTDPESGKTVHIGCNVAIVESTYKMAYAKDYAWLLTHLQLWKDWVKRHE